MAWGREGTKGGLGEAYQGLELNQQGVRMSHAPFS